MLMPAAPSLEQPPTTAVSALASEPQVRASVIIVNYNAGASLKGCLRSLANDDCRDREIILVDNASTDSSAEYIAQVAPGVQLIRSEINLGFSQGNNLGVRSSHGNYLAFLNPDTVVEPGWLEALIAALEADPRAGLATAKILLLGDTVRINTCGCDIHYTGLTLCRGMGMGRNALIDPVDVSAVSGAAFVIRRDLFEALSGFDAAYFLYMEDTDLSWRARLMGYTCLYVPTSVVYHDYSLRFGPKKTFYQERNRYLMLLKGLRWRTLLVLLPALLVAEMITWAFVLFREPQRLANKLRAYVWIAQHWAEVMESRRRTQAVRRVRDRDLIAICTHRLAYEQTGTGLIAGLAHTVFDPVFFILQRLALAIIWW